MKKMFLATLIALMFALSVFGQEPAVFDATGPVSAEVAALASVGRQAGKRFEAKVLVVKDGDTVLVETRDGKRLNVRLPAYDAPVRGKMVVEVTAGEFTTVATRLPAQPHGEASTEYLLQTIQGKTVAFRVYKAADLYGRVVADPIVNGESITLRGIRLGHGWYWQTYGRYLKPTDRKAWNDAMKAAQAAQVGLWSPGHPCAVRPVQWRRSPGCPPKKRIA